MTQANELQSSEFSHENFSNELSPFLASLRDIMFLNSQKSLGFDDVYDSSLPVAEIIQCLRKQNIRNAQDMHTAISILHNGIFNIEGFTSLNSLNNDEAKQNARRYCTQVGTTYFRWFLEILNPNNRPELNTTTEESATAIAAAREPFILAITELIQEVDVTQWPIAKLVRLWEKCQNTEVENAIFAYADQEKNYSIRREGEWTHFNAKGQTPLSHYDEISPKILKTISDLGLIPMVEDTPHVSPYDFKIRLVGPKV